MKYLVLLAALLFSTASLADQVPPLPIEQCITQAPYGFPQTEKQGVGICRTAYVTLNDTVAKIPVWSSYILTPNHALGCVPRSNAFSPDTSLPKGSRAELVDYVGSGFDQGHMVPFGGMDWNAQVGRESFLLSNMVPQTPKNNRGIFKLVETSVRGWVVQRNHPFVIYVGPIYDQTDKTIGFDKVVVPHAFYKIAIDTITKEVAGFIFPYAGITSTDITTVRAPISKIEQQTGVKFAYPIPATELPLTTAWPVDFGALTKAKQAACKAK